MLEQYYAEKAKCEGFTKPTEHKIIEHKIDFTQGIDLTYYPLKELKWKIQNLKAQERHALEQSHAKEETKDGKPVRRSK